MNSQKQRNIDSSAKRSSKETTGVVGFVVALLSLSIIAAGWLGIFIWFLTRETPR